MSTPYLTTSSSYAATFDVVQPQARRPSHARAGLCGGRPRFHCQSDSVESDTGAICNLRMQWNSYIRAETAHACCGPGPRSTCTSVGGMLWRTHGPGIQFCATYSFPSMGRDDTPVCQDAWPPPVEDVVRVLRAGALHPREWRRSPLGAGMSRAAHVPSFHVRTQSARHELEAPGACSLQCAMIRLYDRVYSDSFETGPVHTRAQLSEACTG